MGSPAAPDTRPQATVSPAGACHQGLVLDGHSDAELSNPLIGEALLLNRL